ncbi:MAG: hypothetical protein HC772_04450 [Leptolyngbyaceae cyanobacterium CRU_2_3]|nr:hypothetical protein [Leptolyngbyaceae cyanobacterium CRU_2_3]
MKALKALVYLESCDSVETLTVEFRCWEQLYELIQAAQYRYPTQQAGLERFIDPVPQDFPIFAWQIPWSRYASRPLGKPQPLIVR